MTRAPSPFALVVARACDPKRQRRCCECGEPTRIGEPTCERPECLASLDAAVFGDLDREEARHA
jgi:hypothetical protein